MSLRVWLPLDGDLRNQGISSITMTSNNVSSTASGKIGSCYSFNGTNSFLISDAAILNNDTDDWSYCCWFKPNSQHNGCLFSNRSAVNYAGFAIFYFTTEILFDDGLRWEFTPSTSITVGKWNHLAFIRKKGVGKYLYLNGILIDSTTTTGTPTGATTSTFSIGASQTSPTQASGNQLNGYLNDVRIYDHALSAAEVKEIAQGLVLHYKLDEGNENLLLDAPKSYNPTAYNAYQFDMKENLVAGQTYTLQLWDVVVEHSAKTASQMNLQVYWGGGSVRLLNFSGATYFTTLQDHYAYSPYLCAQITPTSANASGSGATNAWLNIYNSVSNADGTRNMKIGAWKLEKGSFATQWISSEADMTKIQDSSGYNHNGTITGVITAAINTSRYNSCLKFTDGSYIEHQPPQNMYQATYSFWVKADSYTNYGAIYMPKGSPSNNKAPWLSVNTESVKTWAYFGSNSPNYTKGASGSISTNAWHHCVYVWNNGVAQWYLDGELCGNSVTYTTQTYIANSSTCTIGDSYTGSSWSGTPFTGYLSDFRIYCTPLLDTDIKQLYNVGMKIDKAQNIHNFELIEKNYNVLAAAPLCDGFNTHTPLTSPFLNFNSVDEPQFTTNNSSAGTDYLEITPGIYEYDYTISVNSGNQFYIGFERYDANKTSRSNNACVYTYSTKPSANVVKQRYKGTVDLSTDGVNQLKYIALRILNGWSGTTSGVTGQATVHNLSLRLQSAAANPQLIKAGQLIGDEFKEYSNAKFYKDHIVEANQFIER